MVADRRPRDLQRTQAEAEELGHERQALDERLVFLQEVDQILKPLRMMLCVSSHRSFDVGLGASNHGLKAKFRHHP